MIVYSFGLIKPIEFHDILRIRRTEFSWAIVAFAGVVIVGTLKGIIVAIIVSLLTLAYQVADPPVYVLRRKPGTNVFRPQSPEHPDDESFPGLLLLRPEGPIFFANAAQIAHKIEPLVREAQPKIVAVDASGVLDMEYTAVKDVRTTREEAKPAWRSTVADWHDSQSFGDRTTITAGAVAGT